MTQLVQSLFNSIIIEKSHRNYRKDWSPDLASEFELLGLTLYQRMSRRLSLILAEEEPVLLDGERITLLRTVRSLPPIFTPAEQQKLKNSNFLHEAGFVCNISPGYADVIKNGLETYRRIALENKNRIGNTPEQSAFFCAVADSIEAVYDLCKRYRKKALEVGNHIVADMLSYLPAKGASTFHEALQFFRILHYTLWCEGEYHNTVGRFDQYMYPYLKADMESGRISQEEAYDLLLEFFLTFNRDSDLYTGVQQGDNGQSMVLGGVDTEGFPCFNTLSRMCLEASRELKLIDPKINIRVNKDTPHDIYLMGTELTKIGLGFPQYSNDDVVIPGLVDLGYSLEDARDYVVAACWEFIIPKYGMDIPNIAALSFPKVVDNCLRRDLENLSDFDSLMELIRDEISMQCDELISSLKGLFMVPAPFMSVMMDGCMETGNDISLGGRYNNYGFHGTGLSTATDSLASVKKHVFEDKAISLSKLISAMDSDFDGYDELLATLRYESPKLGNDDSAADDIAIKLLDAFAAALVGKRNERGGCFRAGTGSAMYYLWHANDIGASPDGRRKSEAFGANYAPSLFAKIKGPLSMIKSFVKPNLRQCINGGPLTMEFSDTSFRNPDSLKKVASLVEFFVKSGGHQLQLNAINKEHLLEAQKHPENYPRLIVRIWGWSAYFVELDKEFQDHVISRQAHML